MIKRCKSKTITQHFDIKTKLFSGKCIFCGSGYKDGKCPHGHDGSKCKFCGTYNQNKNCPYGHDGCECVICGTYYRKGKCPYGCNSVDRVCDICGACNKNGKCPDEYLCLMLFMNSKL